MQKNGFYLFILFLFFTAPAQAVTRGDAVKHFVQTNYINAAYNDLKLDLLDVGFADSLRMYGWSKGKWTFMTLATWKSLIQSRTTTPGFDKTTRAFTAKFKKINTYCDKQDHCVAHVELHLLQKNKLKFVDFLTLNNNSGAWQITDKTYLAIED